MKALAIALSIVFTSHVNIYSQEKCVLHGYVSNNLGEPIPGATVYLVTVKNGCITDSLGYYTLPVSPNQKYVLLVSAFGYKSFRDTLYINASVKQDVKLKTDVISISEVVVRENYESSKNKRESLSVEIVKDGFIMQNNAGNLIKTIEKLPGVYSMDIGSGFSKPVIRGMAFNRVAVLENGIKQESHQWGADHGLEIDQFNAGRIEVFKGPMSLQYGSDAIGGVIEVLPTLQPLNNKVFAEITPIFKSNNNSLGISAMAGIKQNKWFLKTRYTGQYFGDYKIPADTIVYLSRKLPVHKRRLKNTAGTENDIAISLAYTAQRFSSALTITNIYQRTGFFPGSHGIPELERVNDDGDPRNIEYPSSNVNHLKIINNTKVKLKNWNLQTDLAFQNNLRQEWAKFHTHFGNQLPPIQYPDKELDLNLITVTGNFKIESAGERRWKHTFGVNSDFQDNAIGGYSFLLPQFKKATFGIFAIEQIKLTENLKLTGGLRTDWGKINVKAHTDTILKEYLTRMDIYSPSEVLFYSNRSKELNRLLADFSASIGAIYAPGNKQTLKVNLGKSFRLPAANELASNGVHHGTFRHELGDTSLNSEVGYQLDIAYIYETSGFYFSVTPFLNWFSNYIYLEPSGVWSVLPHAGQIYRYKQAQAFTGGGELTVNYEFANDITIETGVEYVYMQNLTDGYPLPFSPPASVLNGLTWHLHKSSSLANVHFKLEHRYTMRQTRIARNEEPTPGFNLFGFGLTAACAFSNSKIEAHFQLQNIFDTKYYNHLSYYRKLNIPEVGRNVQLTLRYIFN